MTNCTDTTAEHLRSIAIFAGLDDDELEVIATAARHLDADAGTTLVRQGEPGHGMLIVVSGRVEVTRDGEHLAHVGPGGYVGEMALLTRGVRNATVTATTDVELLHIGGPRFAAMLGSFPEVAAKMLPVVAGRSR